MNETIPTAALRRRPHSPLWTALSIAGSVLAVCVLIYIFFVASPPRNKLVISTGDKGNQYYKNALRYKDLLAKEGVILEVRESGGSVENLELLLKDRKPHEDGVDVAFVQSGIADPAKCGVLLNSLGSIYREPLWIFQKAGPPIERLDQLAGKKIAVGKEGSGIRAIAVQLLAANGIGEKEASFQADGGTAAADRLVAGKIDAAFFVVGLEGSAVQRLLRSPEVQLVELSQAAAYTRRYRFLSAVTLPAGLVDLKENVPARDTKLLAPAATLVARRELHYSLVPMLLNAIAKDIEEQRRKGQGDLLSEPGEFPSALYTDLELDADAAHFIKSGPPFLQKYFPFWLASFIDRMKLMVIPLVMLVMPAVRAAPPLMRWRIRRKIYRWYSQLREIDKKMFEGMSKEEARKNLLRLSLLDEQVAYVEIPLSYMEEYYNLRVHLHLVNQRVKAICEETEA